MFLQLIALLLVAFIIWKLLLSKPKLNLPPGPKGIPIFGNLFQVSPRPHETYSKWMEEWGKIFYLKFYNADIVVLNDLKLIKECYNENVFSGRTEAMFTSVLSSGKNGVLLSEGQTWVEQRRFTLRHLRDFGFGKQYMESLIMDEVNDMIEDLKKKEGKSVMMNEKFTLAVINSLWMIITGKKFKQDDEEKLQILYDIDRTFATLSITSIVWLLAPWLLKIFPGPLGFTKTLKVRDQLHHLLHEAVTEHEETLPQDGNPRDFIDAYLLQIKETTDEKSSFYKDEGYKQLIAGIGDLFFAGSDTTSTTLSWTILYLSSYPDIQTKLQMELDSVVGKSRSVSTADRSNLPYTEATISEILRSSSLAVLGVPHMATQDSKLQGYDIPKDCWLTSNLHGVHHDKKIWGDPENFRPERFLSPDGKTVVKNENLIPFSVGKRQCLGETLARDEIFLFLTNIFQRFSVRLDQTKPKPSLEAQEGFIRKPQDHHVIFKDRFV